MRQQEHPRRRARHRPREDNRKRDLEVAVYENPDALVFKGERRARLAAWVCAGCGYTEFYCPDLF